ncbi:MAG: hypothetical protein ACTSUE_08065 [Promethearchaeota archaeon]
MLGTKRHKRMPSTPGGGGSSVTPPPFWRDDSAISVSALSTDTFQSYVRSERSGKRSAATTSTVKSVFRNLFRKVSSLSGESSVHSVPNTPQSLKSQDKVLDFAERDIEKVSVCSAPTLEQVVLGTSLFPYTLASLETHMIREHNIEHLNFWMYVYRWKDRFRTLDKGITTNDLFREMVYIVELFIKPDGAQVVNISHSQRKQIIEFYQESVNSNVVQESSKVNAAIEDEPNAVVLNPTMFDDAFTEVGQLIKRDPFTRYLEERSTTNLTKRMAYKRYGLGAYGFVLGVLVPLLGKNAVGLLFYLGETPNYAEGWQILYLFSWVMWLMGFHYTANAYHRV